MAKSLAVKYRPSSFQDVCSQESIITILTRQLELREFKNAYLFSGASGCGKTTIARIFASMVNHNQGSPIEIDGASNNGVDNVRSIIQSAYERALDCEYKIFIIDECHALSNQAWQAMLKLIEEPPQYSIFIFCTTDPQKIPATILNRVMRFNFTRISSDVIKNRLMYICKNEGFINYESSCDYISRISSGCMRDAISILDKCSDFSNDLNIENVMSASGNYSYHTMFDLINNLIDGKEANVISIIEWLYQSGVDLTLFITQFLSFVLDIHKYVLCKTIKVTKIPEELETNIKSASNFENVSNYYAYVTKRLLECKNMVKGDMDSKSTIEVCLLGIARCQ